MSNDEIPTGGEAEEISPDAGIAEEAAEQVPAEVEQAPEYEYLDVDDSVRAKHVRTKIDGEEASVPFEELVNSYSRESVSTKRFQEAAALRQEAEQAMRLQQALQVNPGLTVQYLAQQAGVPVEQYLNMSPQQRQDAVDTPQAEEPTFEDPLERKLFEQQQQLQQMQEAMAQRAQDEQLMTAVGRLKATYQIDDSQAREVVYQASQLGVGIEALPMVYQSMAFQASQQATAQHTAEQEAEAQRRRQAAANASAVVGSPPSAASATTEVASGNYSDIRAATVAALDELGIT